MTGRVTGRSLAAAGALSLLCFYLGNRLAALLDSLPGTWPERLNGLPGALGAGLLSRPFYISLSSAAVGAGLLAGAAVWLAWLYRLSGGRNYMPGREHGSARWGTPADIKPLMNPVPDLNIPLSATERISLTDLPDFEYNRNKNILLAGAPGSGKTYGAYYPSIMQLHSSYVVTDPKGSL